MNTALDHHTLRLLSAPFLPLDPSCPCFPSPPLVKIVMRPTAVSANISTCRKKETNLTYVNCEKSNYSSDCKQFPSLAILVTLLTCPLILFQFNSFQHVQLSVESNQAITLVSVLLLQRFEIG